MIFFADVKADQPGFSCLFNLKDIVIRDNGYVISL